MADDTARPAAAVPPGAPTPGPTTPGPMSAGPTVATVEALVREQMAKALGGRRGIVEAAVPGVLFTILWLTTKDLRLALIVSLVGAGAALIARLIQRSTLQYVANAVFSVGLGFLFVRLAAGAGGSKSDQALAFFLPGIIYSLVYGTIVVISCLVRWPLFGFMLGSVTGDPTAWHDNRQIVDLCTRLTWLFVVPTIVGVGLQGPVWLLGYTGTMDKDLAVLLLGILRIGLGWPLRVGAWGSMIWLLSRNTTPLEESVAVEGETA